MTDPLPPAGDVWACDRCGQPQGILHLLQGHWLCDTCIVEAGPEELAWK